MYMTKLKLTIKKLVVELNIQTILLLNLIIRFRKSLTLRDKHGNNALQPIQIRESAYTNKKSAQFKNKKQFQISNKKYTTIVSELLDFHRKVQEGITSLCISSQYISTFLYLLTACRQNFALNGNDHIKKYIPNK